MGTIYRKSTTDTGDKRNAENAKNVVFMRVSGVFQSLNRPEIILCKRELFYYFLLVYHTFIEKSNLLRGYIYN